MTWDEFKAEVDRQLKAQGTDGSAEVEYIDISYPEAGEDCGNCIYVGYDPKDNSMAVH